MGTHRRAGLLLAAIGIGVLCHHGAASAAGNQITGISSACGSRGDAVTLRGSDFGALNVRVTVGAVPAKVVIATGSSVTFLVPEGVPDGPATVTTTHRRGNQTGSIHFSVGCVQQLRGDPQAPALSALGDMLSVPESPDQIVDGIIMTRLDVFLGSGTTVAQLNAALQQLNGGIVTMSPGMPAVTVAIPRPPDLPALRALVEAVRALPGINHVGIAAQLTPQVLPDCDSGDLDEFATLATRFPAAWNARGAADCDAPDAECGGPPVPILVCDHFGSEPEGFRPAEIPSFPIDYVANVSQTHGYDVTTTLAARFDNSNPTGANPFPHCLALRGINVIHRSMIDGLVALKDAFPATGKFVVNRSLGWPFCRDIYNCTPGGSVYRRSLLDLAYAAVYWKALTRSRWDDFLIASPAGNLANNVYGPLGSIYPGSAKAKSSSAVNAAGTSNDPFMGFIQSIEDWAPILHPGYPDLTVLEPTDLSEFHDYVRACGTPPREDNVLTVGATTNEDYASQVTEAAFSNTNPDVKAVGVGVLTLGGRQLGTSLAAPQVAGLASYLWLLSPELRELPSQFTRLAIVTNTRNGGTTDIIDAYATVLSLDDVGMPTAESAPVRLAILDVNDSGAFDQADIAEFLAAFQAAEGTPPDHSRYDLNGDGFTGGDTQERFDLDRGVGSVRFGRTGIGEAVNPVLGRTFKEDQLTDRDILCFYAHSPLYTGDPDARTELLAGCPAVTVTVEPNAALVRVDGGTQQFTAVVNGIDDQRVTWSLPAGGGTITETGLFTFGNTPGQFTVRATSVAIPDLFGDATVTSTSGDIQSVQYVSVIARAGAIQDRMLCEVPNCAQFSLPLHLTLQAPEPGGCVASIDATLRRSGNTFTLDADAACCRGVTAPHSPSQIQFVVDVRVSAPFTPFRATETVNPGWATGSRGGVDLTATVLGGGEAMFQAFNGNVGFSRPSDSRDIFGKDSLTFGFAVVLNAPGDGSMSGSGTVGSVTLGPVPPTGAAATRSGSEPEPAGVSATSMPLELDVNAHPNPVTSSASIRYSIPAILDGSHVEISIFDIGGRRVRSLVSGTRDSGEHAATWDLRDDGGQAVGNGMYFYSLSVGAHRKVQRLAVVAQSARRR